MPNIIIYGASDDLVEVEGECREEFYLDRSDRWIGRVLAPNGDALTVFAAFGVRGSYKADWTVGVENTGTWPGWTIRFADRPDREGDPALIIDVPAGTVVVGAE
jgi:hypothetical protein